MGRQALQFLVPLVVFVSAPVLAESQGSPTSPKSDKALLRILNTTTDSVRIEVSTGRGADCDQNTYAVVKSIGPGKSWTLRSDLPICYRVQKDRASPVWSGWNRKTMVRASVAVDSL